MKIKHGFLFALAGLAFSAVVPTADAAVYVPGLAQARFDGASTDKTSDIASAANLTYTAGPIMANTSGSAKDWDTTSWSWADNRVFGYIGEMWVEEGTTYTFGKSVDDWTYIVVNGTNLIDNSTYNAITFGTYTAAETGWVPIEVRVGNGGGGAGLANGAKYGVAYNTAGNTVQNDFKSVANGWAALLDPGDCSLLRVVYSNTDMMTIDSVVVDGNDLVVTASFTGLAAAGTLTAFYGAGDGETTPGDWDSSVVVATPAAGDTASTQYRIAGAGSAAFVAFRLSATAGTSTPIMQWTDSYALALASPAFKFVSTDVGYTNLSYAATCIGLGQGASSVDIDVELATDDAFANVIQTKRLALTGLGSEAVTFVGLTTNTTYYARVVGTNDKHESGASSTVSKTTLDPGFATGIAAFASRGFTTLSASAAVATFGAGSDSATIRLEASADGFTTISATTADVAAEAGSGALLAVQGLAPNSTYALRLRIENEWGLVTYVQVDGTYSTREAPLAATGIGYTATADGSTVDFNFGVSEVFDGATCHATLEYDGKTVGTETFSTAGTLAWSGVSAARGIKTATVTVTSDVDGTTYTQSWSISVDVSSRSYALSTLSELSGLVFHVGDSATLPELPGADDQYFVMDVRSFSLAADGLTLTAIEPGFSAVLAMKWSASAGDFVADPVRALAVCIPEVAGSGRVFFAKPGAKMNWEDTSKWTNVTDPSAEADYPRLADDVAMVALPNDKQVILNADATVGELYIGPDENNVHKKIRITGKSSATLTFARSSGEQGLFRFTGHGRLGSAALADGWTELHVGGGDGNSTTTGLGIEMPGGLLVDGGAWPDYTAWDSDEMKNFGRARYIMGDNMRFWNIPEGKTLRIVNTYSRYKMTGDDQDGNANFTWYEGGRVTGKGTWFYDGASSTITKGQFRSFEGIVKVSNKQAYDGFAAGSRGGSFKFRPYGASEANAAVAENATLLVEGDVGYSGNGLSHSKSIGVVFTGSEHGYGSWSRAINAFPAKKWILNGGYVRAVYVANGDDNWREDGTTNSPPVCIPNGAETLVVSNGLTAVSMSQSGTDSTPTNSLAFASLEHAGDGVLLVSTARTYDSYQNNGAGASWRVRAVLGGFHGHAIGGTGHAVSRHGDASVRTNVLESTAPIVPWIVSDVQYGYNLYFSGADDETDEIVMAGYPPDVALDAVSDPTWNAKSYNLSVALTADRTVNSFVLQSNTGAGKENLGKGRTLTITSGGLILSNNNLAKLGNEEGGTSGEAGTVVFPNKAYVYSVRQSESQPNEIWAAMVSPRGAVFSYPGDLRLGGDQTGIDDHIAVNGMRLQLGSSSNGCEIDVPVHLHGTAKLSVNKAGSFCKQELYFWDHGTPGAQFVPAAGTTEKILKLYIDGVNQKRGTYGATGSGAEFIDDKHFSGTGTVRVLRDDLANPLVIRMK